MKLPRDWLKELELLTWRYAGLGISPDLANMTMMELAGLYLYLRRLSGAAG